MTVDCARREAVCSVLERRVVKTGLRATYICSKADRVKIDPTVLVAGELDS
jgi:hypothetical protein